MLSVPRIGHEGYDEDRRAFRFSMLNGDEIVLCQISDAALDELAGMEGSARIEQFLALKEGVDQTASRLFDEAPVLRGSVIRIFSS
jgi:hypothetical protein